MFFYLGEWGKELEGVVCLWGAFFRMVYVIFFLIFCLRYDFGFWFVLLAYCMSSVVMFVLTLCLFGVIFFVCCNGLYFMLVSVFCCV